MAERGDVILRKRRLGFGSSGGKDRVVVIQATSLNSVLPTTIVVPLDVERSVYANQPRFVPVSAAETGTERGHVALVTLLESLPLDRLEPGAVGRLAAQTLARIDRALRIVLDLS